MVETIDGVRAFRSLSRSSLQRLAARSLPEISFTVAARLMVRADTGSRARFRWDAVPGAVGMVVLLASLRAYQTRSASPCLLFVPSSHLAHCAQVPCLSTCNAHIFRQNSQPFYAVKGVMTRNFKDGINIERAIIVYGDISR